MNTQNYIKKIFSIDTESKFNDYALQLFHYQYKENEIYNNYVNLICNNINEINTYYDIPFLPIELFRTKKIKAKNTKHQTICHRRKSLCRHEVSKVSFLPSSVSLFV